MKKNFLLLIALLTLTGCYGNSYTDENGKVFNAVTTREKQIEKQANSIARKQFLKDLANGEIRTKKEGKCKIVQEKVYTKYNSYWNTIFVSCPDEDM